MLEPIYTRANCRAAYQLRWSLSLFAVQHVPSSTEWLERLKASTERDGVRLLGVSYETAPSDVALAYMNNVAFAQGMAPLFSSSFYVGTFGEYYMNAVRGSH